MPTLTQPATLMPAYVDTTAASIFTSTTTKRYIKGILFHNTNTTAETVKVYLVPNSSGSTGTAANSNKIFERSLNANETYLLPLEFGVPLVMNVAGDSLQASTTTASKVTYVVFKESE